MSFVVEADVVLWFFYLCFFKQKKAYDMRISDWSSDGRSSDLHDRQRGADDAERGRRHADRPQREGTVGEERRERELVVRPGQAGPGLQRQREPQRDDG